MVDDLIATRYKELACAVLRQAHDDYMDAKYYGYSGRSALDIDQMWFDLTDIDRDYFINNLIEKGKKKYGR